MKKFDNHVTKLQKEMSDITNNLNKFRNKNHKTISLIINNLNILSNEIANNNLENETKTSNINSQNDKSSNSIEICNKKINYDDSILLNQNDIDKKSRMYSLLVKKSHYNYKTFFENNKKDDINYKINNNMIQTPRRNYCKINNINNKLNYEYNNKVDDVLKYELKCQTFNHFNNDRKKSKKIYKNNSSSINQDTNREYSNRNINNPNKYFKTEMINKKKNNTLSNLILKAKPDFIYFNRNKQNYYKQNYENFNINKIQTTYHTQRLHTNKSFKQINSFRQNNNIKNMQNYNNLQDNYKNYDKKKESNKYSNMNYEISKNSETEEKIEINKLLFLLKINNINDIKERIKELNNAEIFSNKIISLFYKYNQIKRNEDINLEEILNWYSSSFKNKKENEEYESYCKKLMKRNNIRSFKELKSFIDNIVNKNIQNNNFIGGVKKILSTNIDDNSEFNFADINHF